MIRIDDMGQPAVFTWTQTWNTPTKLDKRTNAVIEAARNSVLSSHEACKKACCCKHCDHAGYCDTGILDRALRRYDKMAKKEADRGEDDTKN